MAQGLVAPHNLQIDFKPSPKQYELWKLLQPNSCPRCGGEIYQKQIGIDRNGNPQFKPTCKECGEQNIPEMILAGGAAGGGKMLNINSSVCTPFGFRPLKELKVGDTISNPTTGGIQKIVYIHPKGKWDFYRIHFVDGTHTDCSEGHLWKAHISRNKSKKAHKYGGDIDTLWEAKQMYEWYQRKKEGMYNGCNLIIPLTKPVIFTTGCHKPTIDPYVLGALIGDGCMTNTIISKGVVEFINEDTEIVERFEKAGYDMSHFNSKSTSPNVKNYYIRDIKLIDDLKKLEIAGNSSINHFIPKYYKLASIEDRIALMQGLIDTDGYVDSRGHITYTTISEQLAKDVAFVVRSLGGVATITKNPSQYRHPITGELIHCNDAYDVQIRTKMNPDLCGISRKRERARYEFNGGASELGKRIVDIEYIGKQESFCISVNDPSGLYITDDFTVTHNSYLSSCWLISSCMRFEGIRAVVARKTIKSLKASTWNTIKFVLQDWGLKEGINYKINNLEGVLTFWNGSQIIMQEMALLPSDESYSRFGSSEFTIAAIDEVNECDEKGVEVLFSRLRWKTHQTFKVPKMLLTTNPDVNWVRSRFVQDDEGNPVKCNEGEYYCPFSIFDNPNVEFRQTYEASLNKITDKATRERLLYGNWDFVDSNDAAAYWKFDGSKHLVDNLKEKAYNPMLPIILSFDFNVIPYMSCLAFQIDYEKKKVYVIDEILGRPEDKENNTPKLAQKIRRKYLNEGHAGGLFVTGDPAGLARSTQTEEGVNNFTILVDNLDDPVLRPRRKLLKKQPSQMARLEFINALFEGFDGWSIEIDMRCRKFTEDLIYQKKNSDGTKSKAKVTDPKLGVKYEKYGHLSDCFDYFCCLFVDKAWGKFQSKSGPGIATVNNIPVYGTFEY